MTRPSADAGSDPRRQTWSLYWVETSDHDEDWFVIATSKRQACRFFVDEEGYDPGDARATLVKRLGGPPATLGWPDDEDLERHGGRLIKRETPRVVEFDGKTYCEGLLEHEILQVDDDRAEIRGEGRPNRTRRPPRT